MRREQAGLTVLELCVVFAIIFILSAVTIPIYRNAMISGKRTACDSNLAQLGKVQMIYAQDHDDYLPHRITFLHNYPLLTSDQSIEQTGAYLWKESLQPYLSRESDIYYSPLDPLARTTPKIDNVYSEIRSLTSYYHVELLVFNRPDQPRYKDQKLPWISLRLSDVAEPSSKAWLEEAAIGAFVSKVTGYQYGIPPDRCTLSILYFDGHVKRKKWPPVDH